MEKFQIGDTIIVIRNNRLNIEKIQHILTSMGEEEESRELIWGPYNILKAPEHLKEHTLREKDYGKTFFTNPYAALAYLHNTFMDEFVNKNTMGDTGKPMKGLKKKMPMPIDDDEDDME